MQIHNGDLLGKWQNFSSEASNIDVGVAIQTTGRLISAPYSNVEHIEASGRRKQLAQ
jgi:hypothetical protein